MSFPTIAGWMLCLVGVKFGADLLILLLSEQRIALSIIPAVSPAIPVGKCGMSSRADAVVHKVRQRLAAGAFEYTVPQQFIGALALRPGASAPIGDIVGQAAIAPQRPVLEVAIREQAAAVARKVMEFSSRGGNYGEQGNGDEQNC